MCNMSIEAGARAGHGRAGRDHVRVPGAGDRTRRRAPPGTRAWRAGGRSPSDEGATFDREVASMARARADGHLRHEPGHGDRRSTTRRSAARRAPRSRKALEVHGSTPASSCSARRSTSCSSASCTNAPSERSARGGRLLRGRRVAETRAHARRAGLASRSSARPRPKGWTRSSGRRAPSGARPAARCASR